MRRIEQGLADSDSEHQPAINAAAADICRVLGLTSLWDAQAEGLQRALSELVEKVSLVPDAFTSTILETGVDDIKAEAEKIALEVADEVDSSSGSIAHHAVPQVVERGILKYAGVLPEEQE